MSLVLVPTATLHALGAGTADDETLTPFLRGPDCRWLWRFRSEQIARSPSDHPWITRVVVDTTSGHPVGLAGFHGPPDERCMVEVGYRTDPAWQRRGYARAALEVLISTATATDGVDVVRATISPENLPSRRLVAQYGLVEVGEQWDDEDGLETIFELPV
ncbi:GNAT family N-acetyltransferase [Aeromicrobium sp. Leaf350]|uniref:GNAT family N-acetyltransferase n=1 Tax=Aeromicrobium sp. Leaf350 TaxID=2876565 RepID=UPI001E373246|nr:GNAT family N-acetyltransferase [Aeromicrobium sp. Leaf350]